MYWVREPQLLKSLDIAVSGILASQKENGQFGTEPWISTDQNVLLALAAVWSLEDSAYYQSEQVLDAIVRGGDAMIDAQDDSGMVTFRKKDHSTWGQTYMPWVYSRWIRAFGLVKGAMNADAHDRWVNALTLGYEGIAKTAIGHVHNIPTHHAMGLFCAGEVFGRDEWKKQAGKFMQQVAAAQSPHGFWAEHEGPVVMYNFVYVEALGVYYAMSNDDDVLDALEKAAQYHAGCVYPDGSMVETVDGRNPYHEGIRLGNVGFAHTAHGRGFLTQQHSLFLAQGQLFDADYAAHMLLYGADGEVVETAAQQDQSVYQMGDDALMLRHAPWFAALSAFTVPIPPNRWGQDRQNFVSIFHDDVGLIVGGGNTKLQPLWSTFTVGDTLLLKHEAGDESPDFSARPGLIHVPDCAKLDVHEDRPSLSLAYGDEDCRVTMRPEGYDVLTLILAASVATGQPVEAHITLMAHLGESVVSDRAKIEFLGDAAFEWDDAEFIEHAGWRLTVPNDSRIVWPALPHNPYRKDGAATIEEARLVVVIPFNDAAKRQTLQLQIV